MTTFNLGAAALLCSAEEGSVVEAPFWVADEGMERMPLDEGVLESLGIGAWRAGEAMMRL